MSTRRLATAMTLRNVTQQHRPPEGRLERFTYAVEHFSTELVPAHWLYDEGIES